MKNKFSILNFPFSIAHRPAFTLLELLLVIGILAGLSGIAGPAYRDYQIRNDLNTAAEQISQALGRAQLRSQAGEQGGRWGFHIPSQTLYKGETYEGREEMFDEYYRFPDTVGTTGLHDVGFARVTGDPSATGSILLTSLRGDTRQINIVVDRHGIAVNVNDRLTVCHCATNPPHMLYLPESAWPAHKNHGDYLGICRIGQPHYGCEQ